MTTAREWRERAAATKRIAVSWGQVRSWGWSNRTATIRYINHRTGRKSFKSDRLVPGQIVLRSAYARQDRDDDLEITSITRQVGEKVYEIEPMPITSCRRCHRETWDLTYGRTCRPRCPR